MNRITFPRISYDGRSITQSDLETWFCNKVETEISKRLKTITIPRNKDQKYWLDYIKNNLNNLLLCSPQDALKLTEEVDLKYKKCFQQKGRKGKTVSTRFGTEILKAFNYANFRSTILKELAEKLNVKSCPYCNMHYTLFAETDDKKHDKIAKLQFDHFFGKAEYPFLSMSLYNLIPSCGVCNQGKSSKKLSLKFHPYASAICDQFHFEVDNPFPLYLGGKMDRIEIKIESDGAAMADLNLFQEMFNLKSLYSRHRDIVQEVFDKEYLKGYYSNLLNFSFINTADRDYFTRLWMGVYPNVSDIELRPMSKFINDLSKQAKVLMGKNTLLGYTNLSGLLP